jgi:hypothetical protein
VRDRALAFLPQIGNQELHGRSKTRDMRLPWEPEPCRATFVRSYGLLFFKYELRGILVEL